MIKDGDADGDMTISFPEFCHLMAKKIKDENAGEELEKVFQTFAKPGSNLIDHRDLKDIFVELGSEVSLQDCKLLIEMNDSDGDGRLDFNEFVYFLMAT